MDKTPVEIAKEKSLKWSPSDIRARYTNQGHFFDRKTMKFFGDTMASFGVFTHEGERYMYRKPQARVNVFGDWKRAGRDLASVWRVEIDPATLDCDLRSAGKLADFGR